MEDNALVSFLLCCSCSCLSHHWLPSTVAAYTHKRTLRKFSFPSPSSAFLSHLKMRFLTPHFFICPPGFCVFSFCFFFHFASCVLCLAEKVDEHTKALILMSKRHFLCCSDVDALRLPSSSSVFSIIPICCGF